MFNALLTCVLIDIGCAVRRSFESWDLKLEYIDEDPKDGELYLGRIKPGETLVEVRRDANVQIARRIWV